MSEVLQANIFFFITGIAVIICTALLCIAIFHGIKVLKSLRRIMDRIEEGTEIISEDMHNVRAYFTEEGLVRRLIATLMSSFGSGGSTRKARKTKHKAELKIKDEA